MTPRLNSLIASWSVRLVLAGLLIAASAPSATAQSIVVMVNDEPITSYDVAQRQRFLALTSGLGDALRERMQSEETKQAFRVYMMEKQPQSQEEAKELQKQFVARLQKKVVAGASKSKRKEAIDQLIEERLMIQAAKERKIIIDETDLNQALTRMAKSGSKDRTLEQFLGSLRSQGVNPVTLKERVRAQLAWRDLIRRTYLPLVRSTVSPVSSTRSSSGSGTTLDAEIVKLGVSGGTDQKAVAQRLVDAEGIRQKFSSCSKLRAQLKGQDQVSVQSVRGAKLDNFPSDVRPALEKAKVGDMTPPVIKGKQVQLVAVCKKTVKAGDKKKRARSAGNEQQEKLELYSQRHLRDLKDRALLKYPKSG